MPCLPESGIEGYVRKYRKEFDFVFNRDLKGKDVLDMGCGSGCETVIAARAGANVTAVDFTQTAIDLTRHLLSEYNLTARLECCNIKSLPFPDNSFDFIFSIGVIHHIDVPEEAVKEAYRVLRPNGTFVIMVYNKWMPWAKKHILHEPYETQKWDGGCPIVKFYSKSDVKELLKDFKIVKIRGYGEWMREYGILARIAVALGLDRYFGCWYAEAKK